MSRTYRQKKTGGKAVAHSCRNHGTCPWCTRNRTYTTLRKLIRCKDEIDSLKWLGE